jgi:hypothetical protein
VYNNNEKAEEIGDTLRLLSYSIHNVQTTDALKAILSLRQLDDVYCAALYLSAAITEYLTIAIKFYTKLSLGTHQFYIISLTLR